MSSTRIKTQEIFQAFEHETENIWRWAFPGLFLLICVFSIVQMEDKILPMSGFELRISGDGSDRSTSLATATAMKQKALQWLEACLKLIRQGTQAV